MTPDHPPSGPEPTNTPQTPTPPADQGTFRGDPSLNPPPTDGHNAAAAVPAHQTAPGGGDVAQGTARSVTRTRTGGIWIGIIIAAIVLILLLIFILQNTTSVTIHYFGFAGALPIAVALLLAAVCGVLLVAIPGTVRILQLRKAAKAPTPTGRPPL